MTRKAAATDRFVDELLVDEQASASIAFVDGAAMRGSMPFFPRPFPWMTIVTQALKNPPTEPSEAAREISDRLDFLSAVQTSYYERRMKLRNISHRRSLAGMLFTWTLWICGVLGGGLAVAHGFHALTLPLAIVPGIAWMSFAVWLSMRRIRTFDNELPTFPWSKRSTANAS